MHFAGETRFATAFLMLERCLKVQGALQQLVVDAQWTEWASGDRVKADAARVRATILDTNHWEKVQQLVELIEPLVKLLRMADSNKPMIGKVYSTCMRIKDHLAAAQLSAVRSKQVQKIWKERFSMLCNDMHLAGYALDPEFWDDDIGDVAAGLMNMVEKLHPDIDMQQKILSQHADWRNRDGGWGRPVVVDAARHMPAHKWWSQYGPACNAKELAQFAASILAQVTSACSCERNWSHYDFVHSRRRNRLDPERANDLVYVFSNLRLTENYQRVDYEEAGWGWYSSDDE